MQLRQVMLVGDWVQPVDQPCKGYIQRRHHALHLLGAGAAGQHGQPDLLIAPGCLLGVCALAQAALHGNEWDAVWREYARI